MYLKDRARFHSLPQNIHINIDLFWTGHDMCYGDFFSDSWNNICLFYVYGQGKD